MKRILLSVFILFCVFTVSAQTPSGKTPVGSATLTQWNKGVELADSGYQFISVADTFAANRGWLKGIAGLLLRVADTSFYVRSNDLKRWVLVGGSGGVVSDTTLNGDVTGGFKSNTVTGIMNHPIPALATGELYYNGTNLYWVNLTLNDILRTGSYANNIAITGLNNLSFNQGSAIKIDSLTHTNNVFYIPDTTGIPIMSINGNAPPKNGAFVLSSLPPSGIAGGDLTGTYPSPTLITVNSNPGVKGDSTTTLVETVDSKGRISNITVKTIQISESQVNNLISDLAGKQASLGFTPENVANKTAIASTSTTTYPNWLGVENYVASVPVGTDSTILFGYGLKSTTTSKTKTGIADTLVIEPIVKAQRDSSTLQTAIATKQATLISGTNIKTVGGNSLLGSGDVPFPSAGTDTTIIAGSGLIQSLSGKIKTLKVDTSLIATKSFVIQQDTNANLTGDVTSAGNATTYNNIVPVAKGGTGTASPSLVAGTNVTITGSFPNQTINANTGVTSVITPTISGNSSISGGVITIPNYNPESAIDTIINMISFSNLTGLLDSGGVSPTFSAGEMILTNGSSTYSKNICLNSTAYAITLLPQYTASVVIVPTSTSTGAYIGTRSVNTFFALDNFGKIDLTGTGTDGTIYIIGNAHTVLATGATKLTHSTTDRIVQTYERDGFTVTYSVRDETTNSAWVSVSYTYDMSNSGNPGPANTSRFSFGSLSATPNLKVDSFAVVSPVVKNAQIVFVNDSKGMYDASIFTNSYTYQLSTFLRSSIFEIGSGDRLEEAVNRLPELLALNGQTYLINIGRNSIASDGAADSLQIQQWYTTLDSTLLAAGRNVINILPFYETTIDQRWFVNWIKRKYPDSSIIDTYSATAHPGLINADNIHPNDLGHNVIFKTVLNSGKVPIKTNFPHYSNNNNYTGIPVGYAATSTGVSTSYGYIPNVSLYSTGTSAGSQSSIGTTTPYNYGAGFTAFEIDGATYGVLAIGKQGANKWGYISGGGTTPNGDLMFGQNNNGTFNPTYTIFGNTGNLSSNGTDLSNGKLQITGGVSFNAGCSLIWGGATSGTSKYVPPLVTTTFTDTIPAVQGTNNQVLGHDGSNHQIWKSLPTSPSIMASAYLTAQTSAINIVTYTTGAADSSYSVSAGVDITALSVNIVNTTVTYTDETNTSRTITLFPMGSTSATLTTGPSNYSPLSEIRVKASTTITLAVTATGAGSQTYNAWGSIIKLHN